MIDLHSHSVFSDGTWTPTQLVHEARRVGLTALALTDHDTTEGLAELTAAMAAAGPSEATGRPLIPVAGVELSVEGPSGALHLLGYCFDPAHPRLDRALLRIRQGRDERNRQIVARLCEQGCALGWEEIAIIAGAGVVGRPHIATALKRAGHVKSREEAFDRYLKRGAAAYVDRYRLPVAEAIDVLNASGGCSVLAHPGIMGLKGDALHDLMRTLTDHGLDGIEVQYPEHSRRQELEYQAAAELFGLVPTGGSDFHGVKGGMVRLGSGYGTMAVSDQTLDRLRARGNRGATRERA